MYFGLFSVPCSKSGNPDLAVSAHIDRDCKSDPAIKKRTKCSLVRCKQKEFVQILCEDCGLNFCLKHRHTEVNYLYSFLDTENVLQQMLLIKDHKCKGPTKQNQANELSMSAVSALQRLLLSNSFFSNKTPQQSSIINRFTFNQSINENIPFANPFGFSAFLILKYHSYKGILMKARHFNEQ